MNGNRKTFWSGVLCGVIMVGAILTFFFVGAMHNLKKEYSETTDLIYNHVHGNLEEAGPVNKEFVDKVSAIYDRIQSDFYFVDKIDEDEMRDAMYRAILSSLDDRYSEYYTEEEYAAFFQDAEGIYYGIGSYVTMDTVTGYAYLSGVFEDSPASRAGLRDGDVLYKIDGEDAGGLTLNEVVSKIKGEEGTVVHITVYREGESDYLEIDVIRGKVTSPTVSYKMQTDEIGYIDINEFDDVTVEQFIQALDFVKENNAKAVIFDLRSNGGGNLSTVLAMCQEILPEGLITYIERVNGDRDEYYCDGDKEIDIPIVVLTNEYTASASELMTGAIRDYKKGTIIGTNTFGKGIVQTIFPLVNGKGKPDGTGMKITTASYFTPLGECIHGKGIKPDVVLEFDSERYYADGVDNQIEYAVDYLNELISK